MKIGVIGGGASGMAAAITAARCGAEVTILEQNDRVGKKILATGNGKCNLSNVHLSDTCYHSGDPHRIGPILHRFGTDDTLEFFHGLGLMTRERNGGLYPACEQASAVLDVLRFALEYQKVAIMTGCRVVQIKTGTERKNEGFLVWIQKEGGQSICAFDKIILACGSSAGLKRPEEENGMELAGGFGLRRIPFFPALVQLRCRETFFRAMAGVRCQAGVTVCADGQTWKENGELQLTEYGISGIPVLQLSRHASRALLHHKTLSAFLDFLPDLTETEWKDMLLARRKEIGFETMEQFWTGIVHKKIASVILKLNCISFHEIARNVTNQKLLSAGNLLKHFPVTVTGVNSFTQAQVCGGGVRLTEVTDSLEARKQKGLYLTGEMLDVDGRCGGYNLQWAWTTGILAGRAAAETI